MDWFFRSFWALVIGALISFAGMALGASMEIEGFGGLIIGFICGVVGIYLGLAVMMISEYGISKSTAVKGEVVDMILNWNTDAHLKNCTSVSKSKN
jgi:hypothetical protein